MASGWLRDYSTLSIVIPAFNEEPGIGGVIPELKARFRGAEIIVVDDGSSDGTLESACAFDGVVVLRHVFNRGYGASLKAGMQAATREFVAWFDADNEHKVEDLAAMADRIGSEPLAAVIAQRTGRSATAVRGIGKFGIRMLARVLKFRAGTDLNCGLRVFRREVIGGYLPLLPDRFSASLTTTMLLIERGYPVAFHPITVGERKGKSKVVLKDGFAAMVKVLDLIMLFAPMRIFFRGGVLLVLIGVAYSLIRALVSGQGVPVAGMLIVVTGILSSLLGLIAKQLSELRLSQLQPQGLVQLVRSPRREPVLGRTLTSVE
jgi:glycosyltransferase involved in cell wall biosynthesis